MVSGAVSKVVDAVVLICVVFYIIYQHKDNIMQGDGIPFWSLKGADFWIASNQLAVLILVLIHGVIYAFKGVCYLLERYWISRFEAQLNQHLDLVTKLLNHPVRHLVELHETQIGETISRASESIESLVEDFIASDEENDSYFDVNEDFNENEVSHRNEISHQNFIENEVFHQNEVPHQNEVFIENEVFHQNEVFNGNQGFSNNEDYDDIFYGHVEHFEEQEPQYDSEEEYEDHDENFNFVPEHEHRSNEEMVFESEDDEELEEVFFHRSSGEVRSRYAGSEYDGGTETFSEPEQDTDEPIADLQLGPLDANNNELYETHADYSDPYLGGQITGSTEKIDLKQDIGVQVERSEQYLGIDPQIKIRDFLMVHQVLSEKDIDYQISNNLDHFKTLLRSNILSKLEERKKSSKVRTKKNRNQ